MRIKKLYERQKLFLFPYGLEEKIATDNEVRLIDTFVNALDIEDCTSLTAYHWESKNGQLSKTNQTNTWQRACSFSNNNIKLYWNYWRPLGWIPVPSYIGAIGEANDIKKHGYKNYIGFGGMQTYFHTPKDDLNCVSPEILDEVGENMVNMFWQVIND